ncbi:flagellar biosynthesis protein FlhF [Aquabacterium sp. CECT 9606]|uniref:flagellar biosynthesis protein FlhF n=1 Tax=Aquabacterium sp. CECT 9606 TaxID=2845822 RepID=UPI001E5E0E63|nr:flagellar biosynthesis protein FlhF [Aquabacterium sp. CECT 9606]CAH0348980.1 Signal recognition particle 54 kDa protein [Aquabacterium sp. CECT 9606]
MNVKRFIGRTSREAMQKVKLEFGNDAVVLSTKPAPEGGIEVLAMAGDSVPSMDSYPPAEREERAPAARQQAAATQAAAPARKAEVAPVAAQSQARSAMANLASTVQDDVKQLAMSTLSFQDYVRERMLKRRQVALKAARTEPALAGTPEDQLSQRLGNVKAQQSVQSSPNVDLSAGLEAWLSSPSVPVQAAAARPPVQAVRPAPQDTSRVAQVLPLRAESREEAQPARQAPAKAVRPASDPAELTLKAVTGRSTASVDSSRPDAATMAALKASQDANASMLNELRAMRAMMKERFETIAFIEKLRRTPAQAGLAQKLLDGGFSAVLIRKMLDAMPAEVSSGAQDENVWAAQVLQRNLNTADKELAIEDQGGIFALIGSTGVGKTTSTAKLAAMFAAKHGAQNLGLITLDAYRVGAHDQLRAYGRILGVPVHMAHDRAALEDLLELLSGKKMVLIDTAGMAQRDGRTKDLLEMLAHPAIRKVLVINASSQGDAIEDVMASYQVNACAGVILSKLDEAVKLGPALDALIRHKSKVLGVANGQRVPEDWHRLSSQALVHRALRASLNPAYRLDPNEVSLVFSTPAMTDVTASPSAL